MCHPSSRAILARLLLTTRVHFLERTIHSFRYDDTYHCHVCLFQCSVVSLVERSFLIRYHVSSSLKGSCAQRFGALHTYIQRNTSRSSHLLRVL